MKIAWQLLKEFWFPLLAALGWAIFNIHSENAGEWDLTKIVNIFGPTFFFLSWALGQFFRVKKQSKVEQNFASMETRLQDLVSKVEHQTDEMLAHFTGGDSFAYLSFSNFDDDRDVCLLSIHCKGRYPMYEVSARIVDLNKIDAGFFDSSTTKELGNLVPSSFKILPGSWNLSHALSHHYNIFFNARNGGYSQTEKIIKIDGSWENARIIQNGGTVLLQFHSANFPLNENGEVDWS